MPFCMLYILVQQHFRCVQLLELNVSLLPPIIAVCLLQVYRDKNNILDWTSLMGDDKKKLLRHLLSKFATFVRPTLSTAVTNLLKAHVSLYYESCLFKVFKRKKYFKYFFYRILLSFTMQDNSSFQTKVKKIAFNVLYCKNHITLTQLNQKDY